MKDAGTIATLETEDIRKDHKLSIIRLNIDDDKSKPLNILSDNPTFHIDLPSDIVQSEIVFNDALTPNIKFKLLVEKYILNNSQFALNLSNQNRFHLIQIYNTIKHSCNLQQIDYRVFNSCSAELYTLMHDNFARFKQSDVYMKYCKSVIH
ncbi:hypothetical protein RFI_24038 [Reticulomyxa filosa]|uniref:RGS domain-containing protein n=2 Tax=Reticulomyxa filosa TaxID=46433 RepID=X6MIR8_RETFI|nr:hypothetical protein RFI_24038 [Reticulomyxa filosa]|eukprot:ETO13337.1 hypothetical protein RFI_24038 [Reticulomyxa filosa]